MRDFYPENWVFQKWLSEKWLKLGAQFGYEEYEGPILEPIELYLEKSSQEIITQQTFTVIDRNKKKLIMRPEMTPTFARLIAQKENELTYPSRWQSWGRFFRYEKPQRGRGRSFYQWNIDLIGSNNILADVEILTLACLSLKCLGITPQEACIKISDRNTLNILLKEKLKVSPSAHKAVFRAIDRIDKIPLDILKDELKKAGLSPNQIDDLLGILNENDPCLFPKIGQLFSYLEQEEIAAYCELDYKIIRGFDYYTGTVFEAWAKTSLKRALFGGGRYDNLTRQIGGKRDLPCIGFAVGDMTIYELLNELNKLPRLETNRVVALVTVFSIETSKASINLANKLRQENIPVELFPEYDKKLEKQLKYANKKRIPYVIIIGPDEIKNNAYILKDLQEYKQEALAYSALVIKLGNFSPDCQITPD